MTTLIACLSSGKGTWGHVQRLIDGQDWDKIILVTNEFGKDNFKLTKKVELVVVDFKKSVKDLIKELVSALKGKVRDIEVGVNLVSGTGKEHMALLSALTKIGVGIRFIAVTKEGIEEI